MTTRRGVLASVGALAIAGCQIPDSEADEDETITAGPTAAGDGSLDVSSSAFDDGESIPARYTVDGANVSPPLAFEGVPDEAVTLALVVDDPDAQGGGFDHWLLWNLPADTEALPEAVPRERVLSEHGDARQGANGFGEIGYRGPAPPEDDEAHTYRFKAYAIDEELDVDTGAKRSTLVSAMDGRVLATGLLTGEYAP